MRNPHADSILPPACKQCQERDGNSPTQSPSSAIMLFADNNEWAGAVHSDKNAFRVLLSNEKPRILPASPLSRTPAYHQRFERGSP